VLGNEPTVLALVRLLSRFILSNPTVVEKNEDDPTSRVGSLGLDRRYPTENAEIYWENFAEVFLVRREWRPAENALSILII